MTDYLKAVGAFPKAQASGNAIATDLAGIYDALPARQSVLRANVTHYPRSDLPGKCFGVVTAFHDLPDFTIAEDLESFTKHLDGLRRGREMPGSLFEVRQVWQMAGDEPRLSAGSEHRVLSGERARALEHDLPCRGRVMRCRGDL